MIPAQYARHTKEQIRILLLEDNDADAELIEMEIRRFGFDATVLRARDESEFSQHLNSANIILADYKLPTFSAEQALSVWNERSLDIPFILIIGAIPDEKGVELMKKRGVSDYVLKDRLLSLGPRIILALERKRLQDELRRSEAKYKAVVVNSPNAIAHVDATGAIIEQTPAAATIFGYTAEEMVGMNALTLVSRENLNEARAALFGLLRRPGGQTKHYFWFYTNPNNEKMVSSQVLLEITARNLLDDPNVGSILVYFHKVGPGEPRGGR